MAFRPLDTAKIRDNLLRRHHHLPQQQDAGADSLDDDPQHPGNGVDLGKVAAVGAQFLPDVGDRIDPDDVDAAVCKRQHKTDHIGQDGGVAVI